MLGANSREAKGYRELECSTFVRTVFKLSTSIFARQKKKEKPLHKGNTGHSICVLILLSVSREQ